jgi:NADH-quinone oxidoreductase subunit J
MSIFLTLFLSFSSLAFLSACSLIFARQPIYSVLFLILVFCNVSAIGFLLQIEFLPISFIMIYVGAIAVLFLFVLMMLDLKVTELKESNEYAHPLNFFICSILVFELMFFFQEDVGIPFVISPFVAEFTNPWNDFFDFTS